MTDEQPRQTLIEREGPDWTLSIDSAQAPTYVVARVSGNGDPALIETYYTEIGKTMDEVIGPGLAFCPIIFEMTDMKPGSVKLSDIFGPGSSVGRRVRKIIIVNDPTRSESGMKEGLVKTLSSLMPNIKRATSIDEAVKMLVKEDSR